MASTNLREYLTDTNRFFGRCNGFIRSSVAREYTDNINSFQLMTYFAEKVILKNLEHSINKINGFLENSDQELESYEAKVTDYLLRSKEALSLLYNLTLKINDLQPNRMRERRVRSLNALIDNNNELLTKYSDSTLRLQQKTWFSNPIRHGLRFDLFLMNLTARLFISMPAPAHELSNETSPQHEITGEYTSQLLSRQQKLTIERFKNLLGEITNPETNLPTTKATRQLVRKDLNSDEFSNSYLSRFPENIPTLTEKFKSYLNQHPSSTWTKEELEEVARVDYPKYR